MAAKVVPKSARKNKGDAVPALPPEKGLTALELAAAEQVFRDLTDTKHIEEQGLTPQEFEEASRELAELAHNVPPLPDEAPDDPNQSDEKPDAAGGQAQRNP